MPQNAYPIAGWLRLDVTLHPPLRLVKIKLAVETFGTAEMTLMAEWCGCALALSQARSQGTRFDQRLQTEKNRTTANSSYEMINRWDGSNHERTGS